LACCTSCGPAGQAGLVLAGAIDLGEVAWGAPGIAAPAGRTVFLVACGMGLDARIMAAEENCEIIVSNSIITELIPRAE
jgi:hypothetical protein